MYSFPASVEVDGACSPCRNAPFRKEVVRVDWSMRQRLRSGRALSLCGATRGSDRDAITRVAGTTSRSGLR